MSQLRKLQRNIVHQEEAADAVPDNHRDLPVGRLLSEPTKGDFLALPLFGWIASRRGTGTPLVMLTVLLIRSLEDPSPRGTLQIELPVYEASELATLAALERFGWDGRVWPLDDGWPSSDSVEEANIRSLMEQAKLKSTLTFPPGEKGVSLQPVTVSRARGDFLMPPLPAPEGEPDPVKLARLRALCADPSTMLLSLH